MTLAITGLYAALIGLLAIGLGIRVSILRANTGISILHGENKKLAEQMRQHGNLMENAPLALILMGIAETVGAGGTAMHAMGIILLVSRLVHPFGIKFDNPKELMRGLGATGTSISMLIAIVYIAMAWMG